MYEHTFIFVRVGVPSVTLAKQRNFRQTCDLWNVTESKQQPIKLLHFTPFGKIWRNSQGERHDKTRGTLAS